MCGIFRILDISLAFTHARTDEDIYAKTQRCTIESRLTEPQSTEHAKRANSGKTQQKNERRIFL